MSRIDLFMTLCDNHRVSLVFLLISLYRVHVYIYFIPSRRLIAVLTEQKVVI